jgi:hypothetical protein
MPDIRSKTDPVVNGCLVIDVKRLSFTEIGLGHLRRHKYELRRNQSPWREKGGERENVYRLHRVNISINGNLEIRRSADPCLRIVETEFDEHCS